MKIGILGSGIVGQTLGASLASSGHEILLGTRSPERLDEKRGYGQSLGDWQAGTGGRGRVGTFADAASHGEVVINATNGDGALQALRLAGAKNLKGKILIDVSNPLDFSKGFPPTLTVCNDDSLGERIQAEFPDSRVIKTLNTTNAAVMVAPGQVGDGDHTLFVSGNDPDAKRAVVQYLKSWFGWQDIVDLGDITTARGAEMILPIWVRLFGALGTAAFNFKIVR